jgi:hypothetical protein
MPDAAKRSLHPALAAVAPVEAQVTLASGVQTLLGAFADEVAARVVAAMVRPTESQRVALADVAKHGAPSARWVCERARAGQIAIRGPRGARFVLASELVALLASTTMRLRAPRGVPPNIAQNDAESATFADDIEAELHNLAAARARRRRA